MANSAIMMNPEKKYELIEKIIVGYELTASQPADWSTNWTDYYTNTGTLKVPVYTAVSGSSAPTWESGKYYSFNSGSTNLIIRNSETDGTPYNFKRCLIFVHSAGVSGAVFNIGKSNTWVSFFSRVEYFNVNMINCLIELWCENGKIISNFPPRWNSNMVIQNAPIDTLCFSGGIIGNSTIEIYGIRF